ncbi:MAG: hypothetical protein M1818_000780 [Claussenomyces sp. TS43310]|nr:MAG: hypothetical protein M1818_000780 [Claussenomyces sp. TS43310]
MASTSVNVFRYSALGAGIFYGIYHQASISASNKVAAINREYEHKQSLITQAKAEYSKKNSPASVKTEGGDMGMVQFEKEFPKLWIQVSTSGNFENSRLIYRHVVIRDPMDSKFDLEAYLNDLDAKTK